MIAYLKGKVVIINAGMVILDVSGVGYKISVNDKVVTKPGDQLELFIYNHIREDANDLYGFNSYDELILFEKLITVNGVGPKVGLSIMSVSDPNKIVSAIIEENIAFFQSVPGIGKKVAAKIILELKSKLSGMQTGSLVEKMQDSSDLIDALSSLGYKGNEISKIISEIPAELIDIEQKIRWCLKNISK